MINNRLIYIMIFYAILSYIVGPMIGYYTMDRSDISAGDGAVVGSVVTIFLWFMYGRNSV